MSKGTCKLDGCEKPRIYRLYCHMHQARLRKTGSPGQDTLVHRYAWERRHGPIPVEKHIDHMLGCDTACCEVEHLRVATHRQNGQHRVRQDARNTSGHRGVYWRGERGVWVAHIKVDGRSIHLGQFPEDQLELAAETARAARVEYFGEFAGTV